MYRLLYNKILHIVFLIASVFSCNKSQFIIYLLASYNFNISSTLCSHEFIFAAEILF